MSTIGDILHLAGDNRKTLGLAAACSVADALLDLVPFYVMYLVVMALLEGQATPGRMAALGLAAAVAVAARALARWLAGSLAHKAGYRTLYAIRRAVAAHLGRLPMLFFSRTTSGALLKVTDKDVESIEVLLCHHLPDLCAAAALPVGTLALLFWISWSLGLAALVPLLLAVQCQVAMYRECSTRMRRFHDSLTDMNSTIVEYVQGIMDIKAFNQTVASFSRFTNSVRTFESVVKEWSRISGKYYALFGTVLGSGLLFVLPPGLVLLGRGSLGLADLVLVLMLVTGYAAPLDRLLRFTSKLREIEEAVRRIKAILEEPALPETARPRLPENHDIEFDNVVFGYDAGQPLFDGLSLRLPAATLTAFVGPSGAGKTTAAMLASRYQDVREGSIRIGGVDVRDIPVARLMDMVSFVFQDTFLLSDTVMENIRAGRADAGDAAVVDAAQKARIHDSILRLPKGYDTFVGDGGSPLSGGERQRLAIARAILRDAPIVILDEATAFADPENEALIQEGISRLLTGKTVIVIGHRLAALTEADAIAVFREGRLDGFGRHEELLETCPLYQTMWAVQAKASDWALAEKEVSDAQSA